ncbi:MAG: hypothetical protein J6Q85_07060 [Clostridia bacterium]|nr:hypothetical protein [Clostridia bacterium]
MNMFDEARAVLGVIKMQNITQGEMARQLGVSQSYVANKLRLLKFSPEMEKKIIEAALTERHARALLRLDNEDKINTALARIIERRLNVAESEALVDMLADTEAPKKIGGADRLFKIDTFKDTLKHSINTLVCAGVDARQSVSYYGTKTYITVCIDEA